MEKSESIKEIAKALALFNIKVGKISKNRTNPFFQSKYADLSSILEAIATPLSECNLVLNQIPDGDGLTTIVIHTESGEYLQANGLMRPIKNDPQSMGSAITYQRRYSICAILGLNVEDDDDGNKSSILTAKATAAPAKEGEPTEWLNKWTSKAMTETHLKYNNAVKALKEGKTIADIRKYYKISKEIEKELMEDVHA